MTGPPARGAGAGSGRGRARTRNGLLWIWLAVAAIGYHPAMRDEFLGESLVPDTTTADTRRMARGEPGLPTIFGWHDETVEIVCVHDAWHDTGPCRHGSGEKYVRRHWFDVETARHGRLKIYFERQARGGKSAPRWWVYSRNREDQAAAGGPASAPA